MRSFGFVMIAVVLSIAAVVGLSSAAQAQAPIALWQALARQELLEQIEFQNWNLGGRRTAQIWSVEPMNPARAHFQQEWYRQWAWQHGFRTGAVQVPYMVQNQYGQQLRARPDVIRWKQNSLPTNGSFIYPNNFPSRTVVPKFTPTGAPIYRGTPTGMHRAR